MRRITLASACAVAFGLGALAAPATAASTGPLMAHGPIAVLDKGTTASATNQSTNWFGYNQGTVEKGGALFSDISATWTVPTAGAHRKGEDESSSTWIGIGGGCIDSGCLAGDSTLIQAGSEQDVDSSGHASYSTWWEIIPVPSVNTGDLAPVTTAVAVKPGDRLHVHIHEVVPLSNVWTIDMKNLTNGQTFTLTLPYTSTHATAEWIEETPTLIGTDGTALAALPNLTRSTFDLATVNGAPAHLTAAERIQLVEETAKSTTLNPQYHVVGTPSLPDSDTDGFNACAWATSCSAPSGS